MASASAITRRALATTTSLPGSAGPTSGPPGDVEFALQAGDMGRDVGLDRADGLGRGRETPVSAIPTNACRCLISIGPLGDREYPKAA